MIKNKKNLIIIPFILFLLSIIGTIAGYELKYISVTFIGETLLIIMFTFIFIPTWIYFSFKNQKIFSLFIALGLFLFLMISDFRIDLLNHAIDSFNILTSNTKKIYGSPYNIRINSSAKMNKVEFEINNIHFSNYEIFFPNYDNFKGKKITVYYLPETKTILSIKY